MSWKKGPLPKDTYFWGGVVPHEMGGEKIVGQGFFLASFCGDHAVAHVGDKNVTLKPFEVAWYNNSIELPPRTE